LELPVVRREVAGGVEELLRHDRRLELYLGEREAATRLLDVAAALEELARRADPQLHDLVTDEVADQALVERHELHRSNLFSLYESSSQF